MLNKVMVIGNVGKDPEMRYTPNGNPVTEFSVASTRNSTVNGEKKPETEWFNVVCWNKTAELVSQHVTKGMRVYVEGRQRTQSWEGNDGQRRYKTTLQADRVLFLDRKNGNGAPSPEGFGNSESIEDLPF